MTDFIARRPATTFESCLKPALAPELKSWYPSPHGTGGFPDIEAKFCLEQYQRREILLAARHGRQLHIPRGLPDRLTSFSWNSETLNLSEITYRATTDDILELEAALKDFNDSGLNLNAISPTTFHLPTYGPRLRALSSKIHDTTGAVIIKGVDPDRFSLKDNIVLFAGQSSYIGDQRGRQSAQNDVLTHLYSNHDSTVADPRPGLSNHSLPFHNDHCDILALHVMQTAHSGGTTRWASFGSIYNEMATSKPQVLEVLARNDWPHETPSHAIKNLPLMFQDDRGTPFLSFTRFALTGLPTYPRSPNSPKLSAEQADALDSIQYFAEKHAVEVAQEKGDMFFINNRTVLHARDKIHDSADQTRRHLMRLCLRDTEFGRSIPEDLKRRWGDIFDGGQDKDGKWMLCKENSASFVSNKAFDSALGYDETTGSHG